MHETRSPDHGSGEAEGHGRGCEEVSRTCPTTVRGAAAEPARRAAPRVGSGRRGRWRPPRARTATEARTGRTGTIGGSGTHDRRGEGLPPGRGRPTGGFVAGRVGREEGRGAR